MGLGRWLLGTLSMMVLGGPLLEGDGAGSAPGTSDAAIRGWYERSLRDHVREEYRRHLAGGDPPGRWLGSLEVDRNEEVHLPPGVVEACDFYRARVEARDIGTVRVMAVPVGPALTYAVRVTTDGDDGWLEIYQRSGRVVGGSRTYLEVVEWGEVDAVRRQAVEGTPPGWLEAMAGRTLWGRSRGGR